jgi:peptide deformylase
MSKKKTWALWSNGKLNDEEAALLRKKAAELAVPFDKGSAQCIQELLESFLSRDDALGLAAPQIGISKKIIIFKNKNFDEKGRVRRQEDFDLLVNPRITQKRGEEEIGSEGCLSCPEISVEISRSPEIKVRAVDQHGNKVNKRYAGFLARIVQHEIDHLDGILIVDHQGTIYYPKEKEEFFQKIFT